MTRSRFRKALSRLLEPLASAWKPYSSGAEFLRAVEIRLPQCVVLDLRMPRQRPTCSGWKQANARCRWSSSPATIRQRGRADALRQGAKAYLRKPVDDATLIDAIRRDPLEPVLRQLSWPVGCTVTIRCGALRATRAAT
jgi:FixJ family two-component response regulator